MSRKLPSERTRPQIGDVIEFETPAGLAYAQFTLHYTAPPRYGALLRVLPGLFPKCPSDFGSLVQQRERFSTFFPLGAACARGIVRIVANEPVPERASGLPLMRMAGGMRRDGRVLNWWLWDGEREWPVDALTEKERELSILEVMNDTALVDRIASGWSPRDET